MIPAEIVYDAYPSSDLLAVEPPEPGESLSGWHERVGSDCGDGLFDFIVREISDAEDDQAALNRVATAQADLQAVYDNLHRWLKGRYDPRDVV